MTHRIARTSHPVAWWVWAIGIAIGATRTTNPLVLLLLIGATGLVAVARRTDAPWARGYHVYLTIAAIVILIRVVFRALLDGQAGATVIFTLPELDLPDQAAGIRVGGPVTLEGLLSAVYDGLRIATPLVCLGAANTLADPKQLIRSMPSAVYEIGTAVTVALASAPQFIESGQRIRQAQQLRGATSRRRVRRVVIPVLEDALDRSLALAAAMDSRGYGRTASLPRLERLAAGSALFGGLVAFTVGVYGVLDATSPTIMGAPTLVLGVTLALVGLWWSGRGVERSRYRPHPWRLTDTTIASSGLLTAAVLIVAARTDPAAMFPSVQPAQWPVVIPLAFVAVGAAIIPALVAPPAPSTTGAAE